MLASPPLRRQAQSSIQTNLKIWSLPAARIAAFSLEVGNQQDGSPVWLATRDTGSYTGGPAKRRVERQGRLLRAPFLGTPVSVPHFHAAGELRRNGRFDRSLPSRRPLNVGSASTGRDECLSKRRSAF